MNYLTLVNKNHLIKDSYFQNLELIDYKNIVDEKIKIEKTSLEAYIQLEEFLKKKDIEIGIEDAYRTLENQQKRMEEFIVQYGMEYANKYVAKPKTSEHHTGLAIDLSIKIGNQFLQDNEDLMKNETILLEVHKYLKDFGFILRYPKGKDDITGYPYEPWHIRYVGKIPATIMYENNLTLEEYIENYSGVLIVNKGKNMTSRDVVNEVSNVLGIKKIGHTGTLDPMAEGVLVLTIGKATKLGELLTEKEKEYIAGVQIGRLTDTLDITGKILKEKSCQKQINYRQLFEKFTTTYLQEVPIYSAVKVNGKKLYEYAREKKKVTLPKKEVTIKELELLEKNHDHFKFRCLVTKGTYIRSLIRDMGESLQEYFTMSSLIRTKQGKFKLEDAYTIEDIKSNKFQILKIEEVLDYPSITLDPILTKKVRNGVQIKNQWDVKDRVIFKDKEESLLVIYKKDGSILKIDKMIYNLLYKD